MSAPKGNHNHLKHGMRYTRLYSIWRTMKQRCNNPNNSKYKNYGGRGIKVCDEWMDFNVFHAWSIANGYSDKLSIDRIDVNGNYCPENCKWSTDTEQANNKTNNRFIAYNKEIMTMADFCRKYHLKYKVFARYIKQGMAIEEAMSKANQKGK